ncbi:lipopolysaccharide assembly protein LapA domain-containing protein [Segnochrobactrum spirostomi]|uniref:DUF1049 domain-containing protein n=1 Tax=Segnochrobactrum spirostomi TaxID=2608987 RepID=A0A6A7Y1T0_9HYPH|nr:lipopolysaccharide assembly protein LapA domain-containing protein [Segnochrobactrum spirostomi]MQT12656.1 DUF1049 domain-containing protein [Segnochrobactrum spirostomi]
MRILKILIVVPVAIVLIAFAVANRQPMSLHLDPFGAATASGLQAELPVYWVVFAALAIGVIVGGVAMWFAGGQHRRAARLHRREAQRLRAEMEFARTHAPVAAGRVAEPPRAALAAPGGQRAA